MKLPFHKRFFRLGEFRVIGTLFAIEIFAVKYPKTTRPVLYILFS